MTCLRRELASAEPTANSGRIRVITDKVGDFLPTASRVSDDSNEPTITLSHHLHALYAPALARRLPPIHPSGATSSRSRTSAQVPALARLSSRVLSILLDPRPRPLPRASAGPGSWTYRLVGWLPSLVVETWLTSVEGVARWAAKHDESSTANVELRVGIVRPNGTGSKRPLPTPPIARPASQTDSSEASGDEAMKRSAAAGASSGGESSEGEPASMAESFVGSEEDWRANVDEEQKATTPVEQQQQQQQAK